MAAAVASLIEVLRRHEERLAEVYAQCAQAFQADGHLWSRLSYEERVHARLMIRMKALHAQGLVVGCEPYPTATAMSESFSRVTAVERQLEAGLLDARTAIAVAIDLEQLTLDADVSRFFEFRHPRLVRIPQILAQDTRQHLRRLQSALEAAG